ncbi:cell division protein FtsQ/DivIB [Paracoccaceae bacterium]|nr:cell division protein FtsQ/DivIB [Paracoccaceae bacterium]
MQQISFSKFRKRDPAPSRLRYKFSRWMLSPLIKKAVVYGFPLVVFAVPILIYFQDQKNREQLEELALDLYRKVIERPEFMLNALSIEGASDNLNAEIREVLGLHFPVSSFDLDIADLRKRVLTLPPVEIAEARIKGGGILHIKVNEKTPALLLKEKIGFTVLSKQGEFIRSVSSREHFSGLPVIIGKGAENAAAQANAIFKEIYGKLDQVRGLVFVGQRRWNLIMASGQVVMLPEKNPEHAIQKIIILDEAEQILSRNISVFDLRLPSRITLRIPPDKYGRINSKVIGVRN